MLHMSVRTEKAYVQWIERFLRFHRYRSGLWRHPNEPEMGSAEINRFLTHLAVDRKVAASTQNQAFSALGGNDAWLRFGKVGKESEPDGVWV